ncbi:deoxynucleoside triphosphate triphosphohydrolase SAMHD1-like protein [Labeo rohita]|uniref:Deoxynucleoside triphosphate triphosphohydrolase SAMHD1-like protein n=1 Tax=Labeo rohita TaxID=84645 RepID=A0A498N190_LABRO|nr:deoxynucleoside triphosphate triphosphohydrolase SAMHD1-like protein [Labeo rohita]
MMSGSEDTKDVKRRKIAEDLQNNSLQFSKDVMKASKAFKGKQKISSVGNYGKHCHGPFSHLFDGMFIPEVRPGNKWQHEEASVQMFHCMRKKNGLDKVMKDCGLNLDEDIIFIEELIQGRTSSDSKWTAKGRPENKSFLYEIVANKLNGIDVDKWDYLARDCHYLGIPNGFDHQRLLKSARVCKVDGRNHICFRDKVADDVYGMFHTRYTLHRQALQHKIGYIIDIKMKEALVRADDKLIPDRKISDAIDDILEYTKLTDHIFDQILNQSDSNPRLDEARSILQDIVNRRLPKFVGEARLNEDKLKVKLRDKFKKEKPDNASRITVYQEELQKQWREMIKDDKPLNAEDFDIYVLDMGFGEVGKEPIDNVHFYSKNEPNKAFKMEKYQVSSLKPKRCHEYLVRVYYNKTDGSYQKLQQKAEEIFHEWCKNNEFIDSEEEESVEETSQNNQSSSGKIFNDPIHGQIELHPLLVKIIDTPQFQRLRHIKQLGGTHLVYPGATHTRFEHSLGDCHHLGIPNSFDHQHMLKFSRVSEREESHLLQRQEAKDKLPKISPVSVSKLQGDIKRKIQRITGASSDTHEDDENSTLRLMKEFAKLTDHIFEEILYSTDVGLEGARKKLEDVVKRRLPKCVGETRLGKKDKHAHKKTLQNDWNEAVDEWNRLHPTVFLDKKDFSVDVIQLHCTYSTGINPIENVYFYRKRNPTEAFKIKKYEVSSLLPEEFTEYVCRIYHTKNSDEEEKDTKECFDWWCHDKCKILVYDQEEFRGNERLITGDCPSLDDCGITEVHSCKVHRGLWKLYEGPNYNEAEYTLEPEKEYRTPTDWDCQSNTSARSLKHVRM